MEADALQVNNVERAVSETWAGSLVRVVTGTAGEMRALIEEMMRLHVWLSCERRQRYWEEELPTYEDIQHHDGPVDTSGMLGYA